MFCLRDRVACPHHAISPRHLLVSMWEENVCSNSTHHHDEADRQHCPVGLLLAWRVVSKVQVASGAAWPCQAAFQKVGRHVWAASKILRCSVVRAVREVPGLFHTRLTEIECCYPDPITPLPHDPTAPLLPHHYPLPRLTRSCSDARS